MALAVSVGVFRFSLICQGFIFSMCQMAVHRFELPCSAGRHGHCLPECFRYVDGALAASCICFVLGHSRLVLCELQL